MGEGDEVEVECPMCVGSGYVECPECDGSGLVDVEYERELKSYIRAIDTVTETTVVETEVEK